MLDWLLIVVSFIHLLVCPFTKVEENFNLNAMHDIFFHQTNLEQYHHLEFPDVVSRTFVGALVISSLASPFVALAHFLGSSKIVCLYIVRCTLGALVLWSLIKLRKRIAKVYGQGTSDWFVLITACQFHFIFYLSRTLFNTMALVLVLLTYYYWLGQEHKKFIILSAAATIIFRSELAILLGLFLLGELLAGRLTIKKTLNTAVPSGLLFLGLNILVDSIFWKRVMWPEGTVLWYNIFENKSHVWGTLPFLWYFYSAIPRALGTSLAFVPLGLIFERRVLPLVIPPLLFVLAYSFLPHKELRFIIYTFPLFNIAAATACSRLWENRKKNKWRGLLALATVGHLVANLLFTCIRLSASRLNYPGAEAYSLLHQIESPQNSVSVHMDILAGTSAGQTGAIRFGELNWNWMYKKTQGNRSIEELHLFTHLIVEADESKYSYNLQPFIETHDVIAKVQGFSHVTFSYKSFPPIQNKLKTWYFILKNRNQKPAKLDTS